MGIYKTHETIYNLENNRPLYRRFSDHALVVSREKPDIAQAFLVGYEQTGYAHWK